MAKSFGCDDDAANELVQGMYIRLTKYVDKVEKIMYDKQNVNTFAGWSVSSDGRQRISAEKMIMPLIKAVQELSAEVEKLKNK